ncbi:MAG TPA: hypothetical protein VIV40_32865 [Kofleriaceae bacterium]
MPEPKPTEAEVQALLASAEAARKRPSRGLWMFAIIVSVICVAGLAYGLITSWHEVPQATTLKPDGSAVTRPREITSGGLGLGLVIGLGAGIVIGSLLALRRQKP